MSISLGSSTISNIYLGTTAVSAGYLGSTQVFGAVTASTYVTGGLKFYVDAGVSGSYPGTGNLWYDLSTSAITASLVGSPTYSSTSGSYIGFNGSGQYATLASAPLQFFDATYSYFVVVVPEANATSMILYQGAESTNNRGAMIQCDSSITPPVGGFGFNGYNNDSIVGCGGAAPITLGNWQSMAFTLDTGSAIPFYLYRNGTISASGSATNGATNLQLEDNEARIGANGNNGENFTGKIAVCMMYDKTLTTAEIQQNHNYFASRYGLATV
jgi:hypothetical protein